MTPAHNPHMLRCGWVPSEDALYCHYHDTEWGRPILDSKALFSKLIQDGMQAGLSWITILRKRDNILKAFDNLDPDIIAHYTDTDRTRLLNTEGIIRSRLKIDAAIHNARIFIQMRDQEHMDFSDFLWQFTGHETLQNQWHDQKDVPAQSPQSKAMSKALKQRGFKFTGPVILYAFMQAVGMINDHTINCHAYKICQALGRS